MTRTDREENLGKRSLDEVVVWGIKQYWSHPELLYPFLVAGIFGLLLELRIELLAELYDVDDGFQLSVDADITALLTDTAAEVLLPAVEEVAWLVVLGVVGLVLITALLSLFAMGIAFLVAADECNERDRTQFDRAKKVLGTFPALVGASVVASILVGIGLLFLIVPGLYLAVKFALTGPAVIIDDHGPIAGLRTSWTRVTGQFQAVSLYIIGGTICTLTIGFLPVIGEILAILVALPILSICLSFLYCHPLSTGPQ